MADDPIIKSILSQWAVDTYERAYSVIYFDLNLCYTNRLCTSYRFSMTN